MLRIERRPRPRYSARRGGRGCGLAGLLLAGGIGLILLLAGEAAPADGRSPRFEPTGTPQPGIAQVSVSSAYTTGGILFDGLKALDGDIGTGWISDPAQPPQGQWIALDLAPGVQVTELGLTDYTTAMRYSRPQTTTLRYADGTAATLAWQNTSQNQRLPLVPPATGRVRLTIDTVWGGAQNTQPVGIAEIVPFSAGDQVGLNTAPAVLPTPPPITGPTSTSPDTVPVTTTATSPSGTNGPDPWRWWLVGAMVLLAGFFLLRGLRRQRGR